MRSNFLGKGVLKTNSANLLSTAGADLILTVVSTQHLQTGHKRPCTITHTHLSVPCCSSALCSSSFDQIKDP